MKKLLVGAICGLAAYKVAKSARLVQRLARWIWEQFVVAILQVAEKNGITDEDVKEFQRIVDKALGIKEKN